jgi:periplasmic protein TonB
MVTLSIPLAFVPPPPPPPPMVQRAAASSSTSRQSLAQTKVFTAPIRIPDHIEIGEVSAPEAPPAFASYTGGVPGGTGIPTTLMQNVLPTIPQIKPKPAEAAPVPSGPIRVSNGVQEAKLIRRVVPVYPPLARQARISGTVRLMGVIAKDGTMQQLQLVSGHPLLVDAAMSAVRQWVYRPTLLSGQPVEVIAPIDVVFTLSQ